MKVCEYIEKEVKSAIAIVDGTELHLPIQLWIGYRNIAPVTRFTEEEINDYDKESGFIGERCGIKCYVDIAASIKYAENYYS